MLVFSTVKSLKAHLSEIRKEGQSIGFSPTMGALHEGHASLIKEAKANKDYSVCSIFVNPTQFNRPSDLKNYPRTLATDIDFLTSIGNDVLFVPSISSIYPARLKKIPDYDFGHLTQVLEGTYRHGHFAGVIQVMHRLLHLIRPDRVYMGLKDYQQQAIIQKLLAFTTLKTELVPCPTIREKDGLAMSSRNKLLSETQRAQAAAIFATLQFAKNNISQYSPAQIQSKAKQQLEHHGFKVDYFEIIDPKTLLPLKQLSNQPALACVAAWLDNVRLIDNLLLQ
jgi:pantoate--beta-alanine ligase